MFSIINKMADACLKVAAVLLFSMIGVLSAQAAQPSKAMLVLDASGSMWGQINGKPKIEIARETIKKLLNDWDANVHVGLSAYGHRRKGDCRDIQTLFPVGPAQKGTILQAVNSLKPKGMTPLSDAVRQAATELKYTENKATVILISDGKETCEADPCEVGKALNQLGVDFTVHVVGFDVKKDEAKGLQCLAKNTGGLYLPASNAGQLKAALTKAVKKVKVVPKPVVKKVASLKPGQYFQAVMKKGERPLAKGLRWDIYQAEQDLAGKRKRVQGSYAPKPVFKLKAGKYVVFVKYGSATAQAEFVVNSINQAARHTVVLNAGSILLKTSLGEGSAYIEKGVRWDVYKDKKIDLQNKRKLVSGTYAATPVYHLNAGKYYVVVKRGQAIQSASFEIAPGERKEKLLILNAGLAFFKATYSKNGAVIEKGMRWDIYHAKKNLEGKRKHVSGSYQTKPLHTLPAGKYLIVAKRGQATQSQEFTVDVAQRTDTTIDMNAGLLVTQATLAKGGEIQKKGMRWDIYHAKKNLEGKRKHISGTYTFKPTFTLPEGRYYVVARNGRAVVSGEVEVKAEERTEQTFDLNAGRVKLVALDKNKVELKKGVRWDVYTSKEGKPSKHLSGTYTAKPIFTLSAGIYVAQVKIGNSVTQHILEVAPGMSEQVDIAIE